jgi:hypothetical protein
VGYLAGDEVGRGVSATGGETLVARLPDGPVVGFRLTRERGRFALGVDWTLVLLPIEVEGAGGAELPDHGAPLALVSALVELHPLGRPRFRLDPFLTVGGGAALVSADVDNRGGQEATLREQWSAGVGVRWRGRAASDRFVALRAGVTRLASPSGGGDLELWAVAIDFGVDP